ncbi:M16 family metallopeptidase [Phorcysia thermohydrogeniphila]|uniref:Putative Zn-dependent peptidase n=1 Tax=Phorcysia thermohydrogeniphila TaxID=936138 RepID=A0A4V2PD59_9BACT|nr:pitrilysin family protein [Phorcysia thermohydrogeniphila]TCK03916.1 putative Zn-dependent peptidase [Phorcysia thermohydrogeniphila]
MELIKLRNGIKVLLNPVDGFEIVACNVFIPRGSSFDRKPGITTLSFKTAFKRSSLRSPLEFSKLQERFGTPFVPEVSVDYSLVRFQVVPEGVVEFFRLFKEVVENPDFSAESFKVEKESLLAAIRSKIENSFSLAYEKIVKMTYCGTSYENMPYGSEESVSSTSLEEAESWFRGSIFPEGTVFSICGKLHSLEEILPLLEGLETFPGDLKRPTTGIRETKKEVVKRKGSAQSFLMVAVEAPAVNEGGYVEFRLLNTLIGEGIGSVLFQELREKRGFAYSTGSIYPTRLGKSRLFLYIGTSPEKEKDVEKALLELLRNLPDFVTPESVSRAKRYLRGGFELDHETRSKKSWYAGFWEVMGKGYSYDSSFIEMIEGISVERLREIAEDVALRPFHEVVVKDE